MRIKLEPNQVFFSWFVDYEKEKKKKKPLTGRKRFPLLPHSSFFPLTQSFSLSHSPLSLSLSFSHSLHSLSLSFSLQFTFSLMKGRTREWKKRIEREREKERKEERGRESHGHDCCYFRNKGRRRHFLPTLELLSLFFLFLSFFFSLSDDIRRLVLDSIKLYLYHVKRRKRERERKRDVISVSLPVILIISSSQSLPFFFWYSYFPSSSLLSFLLPLLPSLSLFPLLLLSWWFLCCI